MSKASRERFIKALNKINDDTSKAGEALADTYRQESATARQAAADAVRHQEAIDAIKAGWATGKASPDDGAAIAAHDLARQQAGALATGAAGRANAAKGKHDRHPSDLAVAEYVGKALEAETGWPVHLVAGQASDLPTPDDATPPIAVVLASVQPAADRFGKVTGRVEIHVWRPDWAAPLPDERWVHDGSVGAGLRPYVNGGVTSESIGGGIAHDRLVVHVKGVMPVAPRLAEPPVPEGMYSVAGLFGTIADRLARKHAFLMNPSQPRAVTHELSRGQWAGFPSSRHPWVGIHKTNLGYNYELTSTETETDEHGVTHMTARGYVLRHQVRADKFSGNGSMTADVWRRDLEPIIGNMVGKGWDMVGTVEAIDLNPGNGTACPITIRIAYRLPLDRLADEAETLDDEDDAA